MSSENPPESSTATAVQSTALRQIFAQLARIAPTSISVLLLGETGSGKEVLAEWIHERSKRAKQPLLRMNCAGLTDAVVESELFGHERGAFTGALAPHAGLFQAADGGTLFLDEAGELPLRTQAKLLRVLESGEITPVGSTRARRVDVRIIAATHRDLQRLVELGQFRQDLYFRLNGVTIRIPPLRERRCEIAPLARRFLREYAEHLQRPELELSPEATQLLEQYDWPGNVRELRSVIERSAVMCSDPILDAGALQLDLSQPSPSRETRKDAPTACEATPAAESPGDVRSSLRAYERAQILAALEQTAGNQTRAAKLLGYSRRTLTNKLNAYDIARPRKPAIAPDHRNGGATPACASDCVR